MTLAAIVEAVRTRFVEGVAESFTPTLPVVHDNAPEPTKASRWARVSVETDMPVQVSAGAPIRYRVTGRLVVNLFARLEAGDAAVVEVLDAMTTAFRGVATASPDIHYRPPGFVGVPARSETWFQRTARVDFFADEVDD